MARLTQQQIQKIMAQQAKSGEEKLEKYKESEREKGTKQFYTEKAEKESKRTEQKAKRFEAVKKSFSGGFDTSKKLPSYLQVKKRVSLAKGVSALAKSFLAPPNVAGYFQGAGTASDYPSGGAGSGRGRGRPAQTFTPKMLPDGTIVRMPVQAFKRAVSMQRAQMRMQVELAKARLSAQPSPQEMPQGYGSLDAEDAFLGQEDNTAAQMQIQRQMQQQQMAQMQQMMPQTQQQSGFARLFDRNQPQVVQRPPMSSGNGPTQRLAIWGGPTSTDPRNNILNAPNIFNKQGETTIGVPRRQGLF